jgi:hypothetical protein
MSDEKHYDHCGECLGEMRCLLPHGHYGPHDDLQDDALNRERIMCDKHAASPHLPAIAVHAEIHRPGKHAVFVRIKVMDSKGDSYYFDAACMNYELKPTFDMNQ